MSKAAIAQLGITMMICAPTKSTPTGSVPSQPLQLQHRSMIVGSVQGESLFFQAEDGLRDGHVTGVQTCALPISRRQPECPLSIASRRIDRMSASSGAVG